MNCLRRSNWTSVIAKELSIKIPMSTPLVGTVVGTGGVSGGGGRETSSSTGGVKEGGAVVAPSWAAVVCSPSASVEGTLQKQKN